VRFAPQTRALDFVLEARPEAQPGESSRWTERSLRPIAARSNRAIGGVLGPDKPRGLPMPAHPAHGALYRAGRRPLQGLLAGLRRAAGRMLGGAGEEHWIWFYYFHCRFIQSPSVKSWRRSEVRDKIAKMGRACR
jgi:hypothetical protein